MPGRRDQPDVRGDLGLAIAELVLESGNVDPFRDGVVGFVDQGPLGALDEDRQATQLSVLPTMIEVQMAVGRPGHIRERDPGSLEGILDRADARRERRVDLRVAEAGAVVEQEYSAGVFHRVPVRRPPLDPQSCPIRLEEPQLGHQERDDAHITHGDPCSRVVPAPDFGREGEHGVHALTRPPVPRYSTVTRLSEVNRGSTSHVTRPRPQLLHLT